MYIEDTVNQQSPTSSEKDILLPEHLYRHRRPPMCLESTQVHTPDENSVSHPPRCRTPTFEVYQKKNNVVTDICSPSISTENRIHGQLRRRAPRPVCLDMLPDRGPLTDVVPRSRTRRWSTDTSIQPPLSRDRVSVPPSPAYAPSPADQQPEDGLSNTPENLRVRRWTTDSHRVGLEMIAGLTTTRMILISGRPFFIDPNSAMKMIRPTQALYRSISTKSTSVIETTASKKPSRRMASLRCTGSLPKVLDATPKTNLAIDVGVVSAAWGDALKKQLPSTRDSAFRPVGIRRGSSAVHQ